MYLKEVRMENFKSFGRRLTVPFMRGFTAVTGPNGSGKSNIGDAILFVLGTRSKKEIRAGRLTDLIFNGGKQGEPADYCKVSLVFDNRDRLMPVEAELVELTRKVRRAPTKEDPEAYHSYFYVNDRAASLKEFVDILAHARISADGYNIVKQGDVTKIVEMGGVERRSLLEDIAGITEFESDVQRAEKRKADVQGNLDRVAIVLDEIKRQLRELKEQRDAAQKFVELTGRMKVAKAKLAARKKREVEANIAGVQEQITKFEQEKAKLETRYEELKDALKRAQVELSEAERKIEAAGGAEAQELQGQVNALRDQAVRAEEKMNYARDEVSGLTQERANLLVEIRKIEKELAKKEKEREQLASDAETAAKQAKSVDEELNRLREMIASSHGAGEITRDLARAKEQYEKKFAEFKEAELAAEKTRLQLEAFDRAVAEMEEAKKTAAFELKEVEFHVNELKKESKGTDKSKTDVEKRLFELRGRQSDLTKELNELEVAIRTLRAEFERRKAELNAHAEVQSAYAHAVSAVLDARDGGALKGIHGTIAELGQTEAKFEVAMQIAAGNRLQAVVVDSDSDAQKAIEFLRDRKLGRAMFIPLSKIIPVQPRGKALMTVKDPKSHGFAVDLVKYDAKYEKAFSFVFGDTVVMADLDGARKQMGGVRLVTTSGDLIEASGAMIGGSIQNDTKLKFKGGEASREQASHKLQAALTHQEVLTDELVKVRAEMHELEAALSTTTASSAGGAAKLEEYESRLEEARRAVAKAETDLAAKVNEQVKESALLAKLKGSTDGLRSELAALDKVREEKGKMLLAGSKKEVAEQVRRLEAQLTESTQNAAGMKAEVDVLGQTLVLVRERKAEMDTKLAETEQAIAKFKSDAEALAEQRAGLNSKMDALAKVEAQMSGKVRDLQKKRDQAFEKVKVAENDISKTADRREVLFDLIARQQGTLPGLEESLGELMVELKTLGVEVAEKELRESLDELKLEINTLERDIAELGPINQMALEEFEKQDRRKTELLEEVARLEQQRDELVKVVDEIAKRKKEGLLKVFHAINENFQRVYPQLSPGGEGELLLENPDDPFLGGLTMKARPRGKKIARLDALSGGEKSIAALAFIFSIQEYDPSPFYCLDEIDMFLDGVNSDIIGRMVKRKSGQAQFILVSLRKVTLKQADVVYGVTMQREGLSEMIANFDVTKISDEEERKAVEEAQKRVEEQLGATAAEEPPESELKPAVEEVVPRKRGGFRKKGEDGGQGASGEDGKKKEKKGDAPSEVTLAANAGGDAT